MQRRNRGAGDARSFIGPEVHLERVDLTLEQRTLARHGWGLHAYRLSDVQHAAIEMQERRLAIAAGTPVQKRRPARRRPGQRVFDQQPDQTRIERRSSHAADEEGRTSG
jgi:hypothetical protein